MSKIEWTDTTWNPMRGCSRVSEGCRHCYAERQAARFSTHALQDGDTPGGVFAGFAQMTQSGPRWTGKVELIPSKLDEPLRRRKPRRIFVNSMSDLFHERLSDEAIAAVFGAMAACQHHTFQVLTKRPERMRRWFEWVAKELRGEAAMLLDCTTDALGLTVHGLGEFYARSRGASWPLPNVWLGVSVEDQATADERIPLLLATPAALRFVSYEPALEAVDFTGWLYDEEPAAPQPKIDWLIVGGESGPSARPCDLAWIRSVVAQGREAGVSVFVKQLGARPYVADPYKDWSVGAPDGCFKPRDRKGGDPAEWPEDLRVREFPEVRR